MADSATDVALRLAEAEADASWWKTAFFISLALYVFVYIMGRRRLMRKIWQRNRELLVARDKAEESDRMKTAFIRSMSHEIRTPLNAINGFSQVLCLPDYELADDEKHDLQQRITTNVEIITVIFNELLELAQGESIAVEQERSAIRINEVCRAAVERARSMSLKKLEISFDTSFDDDFTVNSNSEILSNVLDKMMDNAVKFTEEGSVKLDCKKNDGKLTISVSDTGIGIPEEQRDAVFDNFVKLSEYTEGVGLGLPICRRLIRTLGGDISIDPDYTSGARFVVQFPL